MAKQLDKESVREGHILKVWNLDKPKFSNENTSYYVIHVERDGVEFPIMLTKRELEGAIHRANQNPEDVPKKGWFANVTD